MDRVRRRVDDAMIYASLLLLAWPSLFDDTVRRASGPLSFAIPVGWFSSSASA
jgi:hypothetical protein